MLVFSLAALAAVPGFAFAPTVLAQINPFAGVAVGSIPGDGYLLVWKDSQDQLKVRRVSAAGLPGRLKTVATIGTFDRVHSVAVSASGAWAVFWIGEGGADQVSGGALFDAQGRLIRRLSFPDPILDPGPNGISSSPNVAALPGGGYLVAFAAGNNDEPGGDPLRPTGTDVYVMRLDAAGLIIAGPVRVNEETAGFQTLTGFGVSGSNVVVGWTSWLADGEPQAEVWLEQTASGDVQYYQLPAASPGSEILPELFDQDGFRP